MENLEEMQNVDKERLLGRTSRLSSLKCGSGGVSNMALARFLYYENN